MKLHSLYRFLIVITIFGNACKTPDSKMAGKTDGFSKQANNSGQNEVANSIGSNQKADSSINSQVKAPKKQTDPNKSLVGQDTTALPTTTTDCQNCGMPAEDFPNWRVRVETAKQAHHFCSPKCYFSRQTKPNKAITQVKKVFFKDYYTQAFVEEKAVWFVIKSKIAGPMGADLVPLGDEAAAKEFMADHQGKQILRHNEVVEQVLTNLK